MSLAARTAVVDLLRHEGRSWRLRCPATAHRPAASARRLQRGPDPDTAGVSARGTASDLLLFFYGRIPLDSLKWDGDRRIFDQLIAWDPSV